MEAIDDAKLCYVRGPWAWFTTKELDEQWGDGWGKRPYEHNAGTPYGPRDGEDFAVFCVAWDGPFDPPCEGHTNSPWSVEAINGGAIAWLRTDPWVKTPVAIPAGTTYADFRRLIASAGGTVYQAVT